MEGEAIVMLNLAKKKIVYILDSPIHRQQVAGV